MRWTAEAIENLIRLALEGRSASFIAAALGAASRNAVIGKANRIGVKLNGDGRASTPGGMSARAYRALLAAVPHSKRLPGKQNSAPALSRDHRVIPGSEPGSQPGDRHARKAAWTFAEAEVQEMRRVRFEDIREFACRWPLGDPRSGDFAYCGLKPAEGHSYCAGHCRMAYRRPQRRARGKARESGMAPTRSPVRGGRAEGACTRR
jgi:GcrA cell cycle regulator